MSMGKSELLKLLGQSEHRVTYEQARDLLDHPDVEVRTALAGRTDVEPEILYYLSQDPEAGVRRSVARNAITPSKAYLILAEDADEKVRSGLAARLGVLLPDLTEDERDKAWRATHQVLMLLARDQLPRVRRVLSEAIKAVPTAPSDVIMLLATDAHTEVSTPVLRFSPVLSDEDLLSIISSSPLSASLVAISRREEVSDVVSDAIARTGDVDAVTALLRNDSAQIREETLDAIIDTAPTHEAWHEPLVHRRELPAGAALRIAAFVADNLIAVLAARADFDEATTRRLKDLVRQRLERDQLATALQTMDLDQDFYNAEALALAEEQVQRMAADNTLTCDHIMKAIDNDNFAFAAVAMGQMSQVSTATVMAIVHAASAKGIMALAWKCGFDAADAVHLQMALARVPPNDVIPPRPGGGYDATDAELTWQLEMFGDSTQASA